MQPTVPLGYEQNPSVASLRLLGLPICFGIGADFIGIRSQPRIVHRREDGTVDMPPERDPCTRRLVDREIYIYSVLGLKHEWRGPYLPRAMPPLRVVKSKNGLYEIELPAGSYSVLVEDEGKKYCMFGNMNDEACPVTIKAGELWEYQILINHASD